MKPLTISLILLVLFSSCQKEGDYFPLPSHPKMKYTNVNEQVKFGSHAILDIDGNGTRDFIFSTLLVGDPVFQRDRRQYYINSTIETYLLVNGQEQSPVLNKGDRIASNHPGFNWFEISAIVLTEKIIPVASNPFWQGPWQQANRKYMPIQVKRGGQVFHGWVEMSFNITEEVLIIHRAAISTMPSVAILAGF